jgi:hypothetical protein
MVSQQAGLGLHEGRKLGLYHLRNALMDLLPHALKQRLIRGLLDECVFEDIRRLRWVAPLRHHPSLHQLRQGPLERRAVERRHGLEQIIRKGASDRGPQLRHPFGRGQAVQPRQEGVLQGRRNCQRGQGARQLVMCLALLEQA